MALGRGEFFVCFGRQMHKVYVQPAWMYQNNARDIALGIISVESATRPAPAEANQGDEMWKEQFEQERAKNQLLAKRIDDLEREIAKRPRLGSKIEVPAPAAVHGSKEQNGGATATRSPIEGFPAISLAEELYPFIAERLKTEAPALLMSVSKTIPELEVSIKREKLAIDTSKLIGRVAVLIAEDYFNADRGVKETTDELGRRGWPSANPRVSEAFAELVAMGFLRKTPNNQWRVVEGMKVNVVEA